jgi:hypothetical protein
MQKIALIFVMVMVNCYGLFAQKDKMKDPDYVNYYITIPPIQGDGFSIQFDDIVSKMGYIKLKIKIYNNSNDYIVFKPYESIFRLAQGEFTGKDKIMIIKPHDNEWKVLDMKGDGRCLVDSFIILLKGLYRFSSQDVVQFAPNFQLPPSLNTFATGAFVCNLLAQKKETQETWVKFICTYTGENAGLIDPNKAVIKLENNQEFANGKSNAKPTVLFKGEEDKFTLYFYVPASITDMQFANMQVVWRNTFVDCPVNSIDPIKVNFVIDKGLTIGKNKY